MKKLLAFLAVATLSAGAQAADKGTDFKFGGEIKQMYNWNNNVTFLNSGSLTEQNWQQKNQFHVSAMTSDKMMAYVNFLHAGVWGGSGYNGTSAGFSNTTIGGATGSANAVSSANTVQLSEAWLWWKATDSLSLRSGRQSIDYGDGFVVSKNDENLFPYYFDGLMARWSWDFADLDFGGGKLSDFGFAAVGTGTTDAEVVMYGANLGFKSLPNMVKKFDIFALQVQGDTGTGTGAATAPQISLPGISSTGGSWNILTAGLFTKLDFAMVDFKLNVAIQSGKQKPLLTGSDTTMNGNAFDVELGYNMPEFMKGRVYVGYHMDSGTDSTSTSTVGAYQPMFYNISKYSVAGIWGMGNLTNIDFGLTLSPSEDTTFGLVANIASRTTDKQTGQNTIPFAYGNTFNPAANGVGTDKALATTVGLTAHQNYGHGFGIGAGLNYIMLGNYYKPTGVSVGSALAFDVAAKYSF